jgi:hypothetical protein
VNRRRDDRLQSVAGPALKQHAAADAEVLLIGDEPYGAVAPVTGALRGAAPDHRAGRQEGRRELPGPHRVKVGIYQVRHAQVQADVVAGGEDGVDVGRGVVAGVLPVRSDGLFAPLMNQHRLVASGERKPGRVCGGRGGQGAGRLVELRAGRCGSGRRLSQNKNPPVLWIGLGDCFAPSTLLAPPDLGQPRWALRLFAAHLAI